jgi:hypothetical protein
MVSIGGKTLQMAFVPSVTFDDRRILGAGNPCRGAYRGYRQDKEARERVSWYHGVLPYNVSGWQRADNMCA